MYAPAGGVLDCSVIWCVALGDVSKVEELKRRLDSRDALTAASPGTFRESKQADRVFLSKTWSVRKNRVGNILCNRCSMANVGTVVAKGHAGNRA
ncbi:MAG: hypothetical protein IPP36_07680 [Nitrosomonadales bacterium]|nr:hypothetical protein [Nitrosomonadales bacterium]